MGAVAAGGGAMHMMRMSTESHRDHAPDCEVHREVIRRDVHEHDHDHSQNHDRSYADHHHDHDHSRHFWHERWWDYGSGPCWRWFDEYDEYVWVCEKPRHPEQDGREQLAPPVLYVWRATDAAGPISQLRTSFRRCTG